jgi:hypothetical protein
MHASVLLSMQVQMHVSVLMHVGGAAWRSLSGLVVVVVVVVVVIAHRTVRSHRLCFCTIHLWVATATAFVRSDCTASASIFVFVFLHFLNVIIIAAVVRHATSCDSEALVTCAAIHLLVIGGSSSTLGIDHLISAAAFYSSNAAEEVTRARAS